MQTSFNPTVFVLSKELGYAHSIEGEVAFFTFLTARTVHQLLPGGSMIVGAYTPGLLVHHLGQGVPQPHNDNLQLRVEELATWLNGEIEEDFTPSLFETKDEKGRKTIYVVAYREEEAATTAHSMGYRVREGHLYSGPSGALSPRFQGTVWKDLAVK